MFEGMEMRRPAAPRSVRRLRTALAERPGSAQLHWLAAEPPGPAVMAELASLDLAHLDEADRVLALTAWERQAGWLAAHQQAAIVAVAGVSPGDEDDWGTEEVAAALRLSPTAADRRVQVARALLGGRLPAGAQALAAGRVSYLHVLALVEALADLPDEIARMVEPALVAAAETATVGELRRAARRAAATADPLTEELAHKSAAELRRVVVYPEPHGMATLLATLPAPGAYTVLAALDALATREPAVDSAGDGGVDARRADALVELAAAALADPSLPRAQRGRPAVSVTIDLPTLLGLAERPAELAGYGPIPASLARELAADGDWRRLVTDPVTGTLLDYGRTTYRPPARLVDLVLARDGTCRFPGCARSAERCDLDHSIPWETGGSTSAANVAAVCRRHHRLKTHTRWRELAADGTCTWSSPTGARYIVPPPHRGTTDP